MDKIVAGETAPQAAVEVISPQLLGRAEGKVYPRSSVGGVMTRTVVAVPGSAPLSETAQYMQQRGIHSVVVQPNSGAEWGIMTMRDVLKQIVKEGRSPAGFTVEQLTTRPLITISPETSLSDCAALMVDKNIRRVVVVEDGQPVGIISETDIFRAVGENGAA
jgi:isocitrate dehydrogenase